MNKKIDEIKNRYCNSKDISDSELAEIEYDLQEMEDRLEDLETKSISIAMRKMVVSRDCVRYIVVWKSDKFEEKSYRGLVINSEINSDNLNQQLQAFWEIEMVDE
ncbi:hypothetical protein TNCV_1451721 [Trichonephila clavipes]|nr:hypothetical protein TNCV_1451721 [Trichonephila clavipes]